MLNETAYEVVWAEVAEKDLLGIVTYIAQDSPSQTLKILHKIRKSASGLCQAPMRGCVVPELQAQGILPYRELIVSPWRIIS